MNRKIKPSEPSKYEYIGLAFAALMLVMLANTRQLLGYYGLQQSDYLVKSSASEATNRGLSSLDSLGATTNIVTFLIWAVVGVICFAVVESIFAAIRELRLDAELSSGRYVHPASFTKLRFWQGVVRDAVTFIVSFLLLASSVFGFILFILPLGFSYCRPLLFSTSPSNVAFFLLGLAIIYVNLLIIDVCIRLLLHRRKVFAI